MFGRPIDSTPEWGPRLINPPGVRTVVKSPSADRPTRADSLQVVRRFINKHLAGLADSVQDDATFTISVEVRAPKHGARWHPICRWQGGDSIDAVFARAAAVVSSIPREPTHETQAHRGLVKSRSLLALPQKK